MRTRHRTIEPRPPRGDSDGFALSEPLPRVGIGVGVGPLVRQRSSILADHSAMKADGRSNAQAR